MTFTTYVNVNIIGIEPFILTQTVEGKALHDLAES